MSHLNHESYNLPEVLNWYKNLKELMPVEKKVFEYYSALLKSSTLLDIGFGGGRTTDFLITRCENYIGIDYSEGFVKIVQEKYPHGNIHCMDARDLSFFTNNTFDFVNFSFNGIDYVDYSGREKIFQEINRILKPNGIFFFSTHNKTHSSFAKAPWLDTSQNITTNLKTLIKLLPFIPRHLANKSKEVFESEYAIINDSAHNYNLFTFYTDPPFLKKQLIKQGFCDITFFTKMGIESADKDLDDWIFATCKKSAL